MTTKKKANAKARAAQAAARYWVMDKVSTAAVAGDSSRENSIEALIGSHVRRISLRR